MMTVILSPDVTKRRRKYLSAPVVDKLGENDNKDEQQPAYPPGQQLEPRMSIE